MKNTICWQLYCVFFLLFTGTNGQQPRLEIQPSGSVVTKEIGGSLVLTCRPKVPDPSLVTSLEWKDKYDRKIDTFNRASPIYVQNLPGEPGIILIFPSLTENQAGKYTCSCFYANTEPLNASVEVTTYEDISFVDAPENQYSIVGQDFKVKCKTKGNPTPTIDWSKNNQAIQTNEKFVVDTDELLIKNVTEADDGVYTCTAIETFTGHFKIRNIKVEVQVPPKIQPIEPVTIIEGDTASVKCLATGKPPPTYQWIKLKNREDLSNSDRFEVKKNTGELRVNRIEFENDDGLYKCIAENSVDRVETTVKINVLVRPRIYELLNVTAPISKQTEIICKASGRPTPKITFRKLNRKDSFQLGRQPDDDRVVLEQLLISDNGESLGKLIISNLSRPDDGLYECIAENTVGKAYKNGHITVEFPPTFARTKDLPPVWSWNNRPGNLTCLPEAIPNATIMWKYGDIEIHDNNNFQKIGNGPVSYLIVKPYNDRRFFTQYECIAQNKLGSASIKLKLKQAFVPEPISQAKPEYITATSIKWSLIPANNFDGLPLRSFTVRYKPERELSWDFARNYTWSYGAPYILENLIPEETYHFQFAAKNDVGMGAFANVQTIPMPRRSAPSEPKMIVENHSINEGNKGDIVVPSPYADRFEIRWSVPNDNGDRIINYVIRYCVTEKVNGNWRDSDCVEQIERSIQYTSYELHNLHSDTIYKVEVRAHNSIGDSSPAQVKFKTARGFDPIAPVRHPAMSSAAIIGIAVAVIIVVLIVMDITCFFINKVGIIALCFNSRSKQSDEDDPKLGSLYSWRFPVPYCSYKAAPAHPSSLNLPQPIKLTTSPIDEREPLHEANSTTVEFDGKSVQTKSGEFIGKHSAV
ncbi:fasciclin-2 isoform X1 [Diabrotica undecimpunctata]|uniref:fasciclin-2 isoform X1 n=1 Tax=Diabrotica undecimpunctata TaxID=50387 RepID=UPI003B6370D9